MSMETLTEAAAISELVVSLEQAAFMAKQLPATADPSHLLQIHSSLHQAHRHLSNFLSNTPLPLAAAAADEPMEVGDDEEGDSNTTIDRVEEKMRDCFIKNKRPKRRLSPSSMAVAEERRTDEDGCGFGEVGFDPRGSRLRALDLVYQFHG